MTYKLGSLFDGSGGFPLAGVLCGIEPVWAAEVEPYPIAVTSSRFPNMKHLGDISKVNGADIEPVDIITFGSPCQDLSVAGKRAGLKHEANGDEETTRSGLFMEAVRIIKEMRKATNGQYPRFALWENVPGAFSSNKGEDFRVVCEELIKIVEPAAFMPPVPKNGWNYADSYIGDGWSLAYRVLDAQYWGVPQRRRRIYLVADFRGECAREVLFERQGLRGYFAEGRTPWQTTPENAQGGTGADDREGATAGGRGRQLDAVGVINAIGGNAENSQETETFPTLTNGTCPGFNNAVAVPYTLKIRGGVDVDSSGKSAGKGALIQTDLNATLGTSQDQYLFQPVLVTPLGVDIYNGLETGDKAATLTTQGGGTASGPSVIIPIHDQATRFSGKRGDRTDGKGKGLGVGEPGDPMNTLTQGDRHAVAYGVDGYNQAVTGDKSIALRCKADNEHQPLVVYAVDQGGEPAVAYGLDRASFNQGQNAKFDFLVQKERQPTLTARGPGAVGYAMQGFGDYRESEQASSCKARDYKDATDLIVQPRYIVRRLTPTECARLQGFADWWGIVEPKDTLTDEEYRFWCKVNLEYALIQGTARPDSEGWYEIWREVRPKKGEDFEPYWENTGKPYKHKTNKAMLTWYNKLYTDSAEYKMWGNGIALPTALYCMQGVVDALNTEEDDEDWML